MCGGGSKPAAAPAPKPDPTIATRGADSAAGASGGLTNAKAPVTTGSSSSGLGGDGGGATGLSSVLGG